MALFVICKQMPLRSSAYVHVVLLALLELYDTICESKQGVVLATTNVLTRRDMRTTLANDNLTSLDRLTTINLGAKPLRMGIATVTRRAQAFFMRHNPTCLSSFEHVL